jgi:hypothetical protein
MTFFRDSKIETYQKMWRLVRILTNTASASFVKVHGEQGANCVHLLIQGGDEEGAEGQLCLPL